MNTLPRNSKSIAQAITEEIEAEGDEENRQPVKGHHPGSLQQQLATAVEHGPPLGGGRLGAQAEETQPRRVENRGCQAQRSLHDQWRHAIRQDAEQHDTCVAGTEGASRLDVGQLSQQQNLTAHEAGKLRHEDDADGNHHIVDARTDDGDDGEFCAGAGDGGGAFCDAAAFCDGADV